MAMSGAVKSKEGTDLIGNMQELCTDILSSFRECHHVCLQSKLFTKDVILKIDQCAIDFRRLSFSTVTIAQRVSNQWLDVAITFFENIDEADDPKEVLKLLGDQAKEIAQCFKVVAAWARYLAGRFYAAHDGTIQEAKVFKQVFKAAQEKAEHTKQLASEVVSKATKVRQEAKEVEDAWQSAHDILGWVPIIGLVTYVGTTTAGRKTVLASQVEEKALHKLHESEQELSQKTSQNDKARFIARKAGTLVEVLKNLEQICELVAAFWNTEAERFDSQGAKMRTVPVSVLKGMKNIDLWTKAKDEMDRYVTAMGVINNCFNFTTDARPQDVQSIRFPTLELEFSIPAGINIKEI